MSCNALPMLVFPADEAPFRNSTREVRDRRALGPMLHGARRAPVGEVQAAACLRGEIGDGVEHAARKEQAAVEGLVVGVQEGRDGVDVYLAPRSERSAARLSSSAPS